MNSLVACVVACSVILLSIGSPGHGADNTTQPSAADSAAAILEKMLHRRDKIASIEFTVATSCETFRYPRADLDREFEGATAEYHFWRSPTVNRADVRESRPRAPERSVVERLAQTRDLIRWIPGEGRMAAQEHRPIRDAVIIQMAGGWFGQGLDPRYIGLWPTMFAGLRMTSFDVVEFVGGLIAHHDVAVEDLGDAVILSGSGHNRDGGWDLIDMSSLPQWSYTIDKRLMVPTEVQFIGRQGGPGVATILHTNWVERDGIPLPSSARYVKRNADQTLAAESWRFNYVSLNKPIPAGIAEWNSLRLWKDAVVQIFGEEGAAGQKLVQWRDGDFHPYLPTANTGVNSNGPYAPKRPQRQLMIVIASIAVLGAILMVIGLRNLRSTRLRQ